MNRRVFLAGIAAAPTLTVAASPAGTGISLIDIVHHTHLDIGYTALPLVVRDDQIRYLDAAIDAALADPTFRWTVETLVELHDWWQSAAPSRRNILTDLIAQDRMDVMGLPFNQTPFLNAQQWREMLAWIPETLWTALRIRAAMQNDVNGFPRAGAVALHQHGIHHLLMGINSDSGGPPFRRPDAFWWKLPGGGRIFVWLGEHYGSLMNYLAPARLGAAYQTSEEALRAAHAKLSARLQSIQSDGYSYPRLILTHTHPQRYDNGHCYPSLAPFVTAWNQLGLAPALRLTTATSAIHAMERTAGARAPELEGEWTDWWANGDASGPREVAASRVAKRAVAAAMSPFFGPMPAHGQASVHTILRDLCLFDEHTWGSANSVSAPWSYDTIAQYTQKSDLAYRPMGAANALLHRRMRQKFDAQPTRIHIANPTAGRASGWVNVAPLPASVVALQPPHGEPIPILGEGTQRRCWVDLQPNTAISCSPVTEAVRQPAPPSAPQIRHDASGWPAAALWPGMARPLFDGLFGHFLAVTTAPGADRRTITTLHARWDAELWKRSFLQTQGQYETARCEESPYTLRYSQQLRHPRLSAAHRTLELWRTEPRARITVSLDRSSSTAPEVLFLEFHLPGGLPLPVLSTGGLPFTPYRDQLRGSCRDYFAIDGWAHYATQQGHWLWVSRDAPLVALGAPHVVERHQQEPAQPNRILARIFDNCWHTNFVADSHGRMEFQVDLTWSTRIDNPSGFADGLSSDPLLLAMNGREEESIIQHIDRP